MRIIKIPNCPYPTFDEIRDEILSKVPFALINDVYHQKAEIAYFYFWDSDYIPDELKRFIMQPPLEVKFDFSHIELPEKELHSSPEFKITKVESIEFVDTEAINNLTEEKVKKQTYADLPRFSESEVDTILSAVSEPLDCQHPECIYANHHAGPHSDNEELETEETEFTPIDKE